MKYSGINIYSWGDDILPHRVPDKPDKKSNLGLILNMYSKGESSKTSSVKNVDSGYEESTTSYNHRMDKNPKK